MKIDNVNSVYTNKKYNSKRQEMLSQGSLSSLNSQTNITYNYPVFFTSATMSVKSIKPVANNRPIQARISELEELFPSESYPELDLKDVGEDINRYKDKLQTKLLSGKTIAQIVIDALDELDSDKRKDIMKMWFGLGGYEPSTMAAICNKWENAEQSVSKLKKVTIKKLKLIINGEKDLYEHFEEHLLNVKALFPGLIPENLPPEKQTNRILTEAIKSKKSEIDNALKSIMKEENGKKKCELISFLLGLNDENKLYRQVEVIDKLGCKDRNEFLGLLRNAKDSFHKKMKITVQTNYIKPAKTDAFLTKASLLSILFPDELYRFVRNTTTKDRYLGLLEKTKDGVSIKERFKNVVDNFSDKDLDKIQGIFDEKLSNKETSREEIKEKWQQLLILSFGLSGEVKTRHAIKELLNITDITDDQFEQLLNKGIELAGEKLNVNQKKITKTSPKSANAKSSKPKREIGKKAFIKEKAGNLVPKEENQLKPNGKFIINNEIKEKKEISVSKNEMVLNSDEILLLQKNQVKNANRTRKKKQKSRLTIKDLNISRYKDNIKYLIPVINIDNISSPEKLIDAISLRKEEITKALECFNRLEDGDIMKEIIKLLLGIDYTKLYTQNKAFSVLKGKIEIESGGKKSLSLDKYNNLCIMAKDIFRKEMGGEPIKRKSPLVGSRVDILTDIFNVKFIDIDRKEDLSKVLEVKILQNKSIKEILKFAIDQFNPTIQDIDSVKQTFASLFNLEDGGLISIKELHKLTGFSENCIVTMRNDAVNLIKQILISNNLTFNPSKTPDRPLKIYNHPAPKIIDMNHSNSI